MTQAAAAAAGDGLDATLVDVLVDLFGLDPAELAPGATLEADLALDSLAVVELQVALEEAYGVRLDVDDRAAVPDLGALQRLIDAAVARGEPSAPVLRLRADGVSGEARSADPFPG